MSDYILGLVTIPAAVLLVVGVVFTGAKLRAWWTEYRPGFNADDHNMVWRSRVAAAIVLAPRFFMVHLPAGLVVAYRSAGPRMVSRGRLLADEDVAYLAGEVHRAVRELTMSDADGVSHRLDG